MSYDDKYPDMSAMYAFQFEYENKLKDKIKELETELERTRKALDLAKNAINSAVDHNIINCVARGIDPRTDDTSVTLCNALEQIKALEQKDVK